MGRLKKPVAAVAADATLTTASATAPATVSGPPALPAALPIRNHRFTVILSEEEFAGAEEMAGLINSSIAEVIRRSLPVARREILASKAGVNQELCLSGDNLTVTAKNQAIAAFSDGKGPALAAREAGITLRTIRVWLKDDPVFAQLAQENSYQAVEEIETCLYKAAKKGNVSAMFGVLNAKHDQYGMLRPDMLRPMTDKIAEMVNRVARTYVSIADYESFSREILRGMESVVRDVSGGRKSR